jgi:hypothetical protein
MAGAPMGSAFRNIDNNINCPPGDVEGIGMWDQ